MSTSIVIATYNRAPLLEECLAQLRLQAFRPEDEVVVVDNGSNDGTASVVKAAATMFPVRLQYVLETTPGKARALAAGVATSRGDVLALTDDDVLVGDDWVTAIRGVWHDANVGLVGGRVLPKWAGRVPSWLRVRAQQGYGPLAAPLALVDYGPTRAPLGARTALGANMIVSRRAWDAAGGVPLGLGKLRGTLLSGEDHALCERVQAAGFTAIYDPRLVVRHHVPAERLRLRYHVRWFFWSGITNAALDRSLASRGARHTTGHQPVPARHWVARGIAGSGRTVGAAVSGRPADAAEAVVEVAFSLGYLAFSCGWIRTHHEPARESRRLEAA